MTAVERGEKVLDDVVEAPVGAGLFDGIDVSGGREDAEAVGFTGCGFTKTAGAVLGETAAGGAGDDVVGKGGKEATEFFELGGLPPDELECEPFGCAGTDTRELFEVGNEGVEAFGVFGVHEEENTGRGFFRIDLGGACPSQTLHAPAQRQGFFETKNPCLWLGLNVVKSLLAEKFFRFLGKGIFGTILALTLRVFYSYNSQDHWDRILFAGASAHQSRPRTDGRDE